MLAPPIVNEDAGGGVVGLEQDLRSIETAARNEKALGTHEEAVGRRQQAKQPGVEQVGLPGRKQEDGTQQRGQDERRQGTESIDLDRQQGGRDQQGRQRDAVDLV